MGFNRDSAAGRICIAAPTCIILGQFTRDGHANNREKQTNDTNRQR